MFLFLALFLCAGVLVVQIRVSQVGKQDHKLANFRAFLPPWEYEAIKEVEEFKVDNVESLLGQVPRVVRNCYEEFQKEYPKDSIKVNFTRAIQALNQHGKVAQYAKAVFAEKQYKDEQEKLSEANWKDHVLAFKIADKVSLENANALLRAKSDPEDNKRFKQMLDENWNDSGFFDVVYEPSSSSNSKSSDAVVDTSA